MTITHRIDTKAAIIYFDVVGSFTLTEMLESIDRVIADPEFRSGLKILSDHRRIGEPATPTQVRATLSHLKSLRDVMGDARWAIVATKPASFGMMRMLAVLAETIPLEVEVFKDVESARLWLQKPDD